MNYLKNTLTISLLFLQVFAFGQHKSADILDVWLTNGKEPAKIEIYKSNGNYFGKISWLKFPKDKNGEKKDINNPVKLLRTRKIIGLPILKDFNFDGSSKWINGKIYDPESGKTYSCTIKLQDNSTLEIRGFFGISLFGRTEIWKRI